MARFNWKEIELPVLKNILSTEENLPLPRDQWPMWARNDHNFTGAWFSFKGGKFAESTGHLSTDEIRAQVDIERTDAQDPSLRYYRFFFVETKDGRAFQAGPFKDLEFCRSRGERPDRLNKYRSGPPQFDP